MKKKLPQRLIIFVTTKCNLRCKHCLFSSFLNNQSPDLTPEDMKKLMANYTERLQNVIITGGEPFLNKDLANIVCNIKAKTIIIPTNGYCPDSIVGESEKILNGIANINRITISISLDGPEHIHDKIRGVSNSYKNALETHTRLKNLEKKFPKLSVGRSATINNMNIEYLDEMAKASWDKNEMFNFQLVRSINHSSLPSHLRDNMTLQDELSTIPTNFVNKVSGRLTQIKSILSNNLSISLKYPQSNKLRSLINYLSTLGLIKIALKTIKEKRRIFSCRAGNDIAVIYSDLDVSFCEFMKPFGNLSDYNFNFAKLWNSKNAQDLRKFVRKCFCTHTCFANFNKYDFRKFTAAFWRI